MGSMARSCDGTEASEANGIAPSMTEVYRQLSHVVEARRPELVEPSNTELLSLVQEANQLPHANQTPTERLLDAKLFRSLTRCGDVKARRLSFGSTPQTPIEVVLAIREKYKIDEPQFVEDNDSWVEPTETPTFKIDWAQLGEDTVTLFSTAPGLRCLKGFKAEVERKRRATGTQTRREKPSDVIQAPDQHSARDLTKAATDTERSVNKLWRILNEETNPDGVPLLHLTLDHDSFPQTVLNAFNVTFLIKDMKVALVEGRHGELFVKPMKQRPSKSHPETRQQRFITVTHKLWKDWCSRVPKEVCRMMQNSASDEEEFETESIEMEPPQPSLKPRRLSSASSKGKRGRTCLS